MRVRNRHMNRSGFTLMELLLVMAILVVMGGMVSFAFLQIQGNSMMDLTQTQVNTLEAACMQFKLTHNRFPQQLQDLSTTPSGMTQRQWRGPYLEENIPADPWGNPYDYSKDERQQKVFIRSAGPDGQMNTEDDVPDPEAARRQTAQR